MKGILIAIALMATIPCALGLNATQVDKAIAWYDTSFPALAGDVVSLQKNDTEIKAWTNAFNAAGITPADIVQTIQAAKAAGFSTPAEFQAQQENNGKFSLEAEDVAFQGSKPLSGLNWSDVSIKAKRIAWTANGNAGAGSQMEGDGTAMAASKSGDKSATITPRPAGNPRFVPDGNGNRIWGYPTIGIKGSNEIALLTQEELAAYGLTRGMYY